VYIGSSVRIEPGVSVTDPAWIGHGSHLAPVPRWCAACCLQLIGVRFSWRYLKWYPFGLSLSKPLRTLRQAQDERENLAGFCP